MRELVDEVVAIFHRLHALAADLHGEGERSAGRRGVLRGLARGGPQTVPEMARARPVSRQYIQLIVDGLAADGLVELVDNPAHARSRRVRITAAGHRVLVESEARERPLLAAVAARVAARDVARATRALRQVRDALAGAHASLAGRRAQASRAGSMRRPSGT